jgi:folate-binding protein YgfZ
MTAMQAALLSDRGVMRVNGADAVHFLDNLVTCNVETLAVGAAAYAALLTPQGKIIADFLILRETDNAFALDVSKAALAELAKRLTLYKLRAAVTVTDGSDAMAVAAVWGAQAAPRLDPGGGMLFADPRLAALGWRAVLPREQAAALADGLPGTEADYHRRRIGLGVPEGGRDFAFGEAFPHDADLDQLNGVDFRKGCYVGQEIVSRMQHRGTARRRIVKARGAVALPASGTALLAGSRAVGELGSTDGRDGLALVRIDRVSEARAEGAPVTAEGIAVELAIPEWARFAWPAAAAPETSAR